MKCTLLPECLWRAGKRKRNKKKRFTSEKTLIQLSNLIKDISRHLKYWNFFSTHEQNICFKVVRYFDHVIFLTNQKALCTHHVFSDCPRKKIFQSKHGIWYHVILLLNSRGIIFEKSPKKQLSYGVKLDIWAQRCFLFRVMFWVFLKKYRELV